jgi:excisionase family DNA binding protein
MRTKAELRSWLQAKIPETDNQQPSIDECRKLARKAAKALCRLGIGKFLLPAERLESVSECVALLADMLGSIGEPEFIDVKQASTILGCSERTLREMVRRGAISHYRVGVGRGAIRFKMADLEGFSRPLHHLL